MAEQPGEGRETGPLHFPWRPLAVLAVLLAGLLAFIHQQAVRPVVHAVDGLAMGSTWSVRVAAPRDLDVAAVQVALQAQLDAINRELSNYQPEAGLARLNAAPHGDWQPLSPHLEAVLARGLALYRETGGAFDMTVRPLVRLWGFGAGATPRSAPPADSEIAALRAQLGSDKVELADGRLRRLAPVSLDVDAIAPGYAADVLSATLIARGLPDHLVEVGGELLARGKRPDGSPWRVGIERPQLTRGEVAQVIAVSDQAIATSGDYRAYFEAGGRRYSHTIDPRTGRPVAHALASVTVLAPSAMDADALATAIMVLGPEAGMALAEDKGLPVFMLLRGEGTPPVFSERYNQRFAPYLEAR